ncbi:hypothetical protein SAMN05880566_1489 [Janthinobacterium sp. TND4EL3]|nr:hypothetical protein SAMN05880566_1489 [Janthinobacterium sp. TND4EL3]
MCLKLLLCSEAPAAPAWCLAAMEVAFGPSYRVEPRGDSMLPLETPQRHSGIAIMVIEQATRFDPHDVRRLIEWCQVHDKVVLACGVLTEDERESYGLNHCIELDIIVPHAPRCIQWTSCAGTLHLFEEMIVPTLKTAQRTSHLYCSGLRCQHHRSRETTGTQRTWTPRQGPERRKCLTGRSHAISFPQGDNPSATRH